MSKQRRWLALSACVSLAACGASSPSGSEQVAQRQARVALPAQVSAGFAIHDSKPTIDRDATLLNVTGSIGGGYLLTYGVKHSPADWSRGELAFVSGIPASPSYELVFVQWDPAGGEPRSLARLRCGWPRSAQAVDVDSGWLVVYQVMGDSNIERHAVVLARDGSLSPPTDLPVSCANGFTGVTRGGSSVLVADACGKGLMLNLSGHLESSLTLVTPPPPVFSLLYGGLPAFNGMDYLVDYGPNMFNPDPRHAFGVPVTPAGGVGTPLVVAVPRVGTFGIVAPTGIVANGNAFLTLLSQSQGTVSGNDSSYRIATEAPDHSFTFAAERYLPGGPNSTSSAPTDLGAAALTLNGHFAIARTKSTGQTELIYPSSDPGLPDATQPLTLGLPLTAAPFVSTNSQSSDGTRLLFASGQQAVRLDASFQALDAAPAELVKALPQQFMPSFAFSGQHYFAAWAEGGFGDSGSITKVLGRRLSASGTLLDSASIELSSGLRSNVDPLVVGTPALFATLTNDNYAEGAVLTDAEPPVLTTIPGALPSLDGIALTTDGSSLTAAFHDDFALVMRKLNGAGIWADPVILNHDYVSSHSRIAVGFNAGQYAVLWTSPGDPGQRVVYGVRTSSDFVLLDDPPKELLRFNCPDFPNVPGRTYDIGLQLIASGDHFLFAWSDVNNGTEGLHIARLSNTLGLLDAGGVLVATQPFQQTLVTTRRVALGWDGSLAWVVWRDNEGDARPGLASLRGRRFADTLDPIDADSFLISNDLYELSKVTLAVGNGGRSLVGYTRYVPSEYSYRVHARFLSSAPFSDAVPCNDASQCENGFCTAGLCSSIPGTGGGGSAGGGSLGGASGSSGSLGGASGSSGSLGDLGGTSSSIGGVSGASDSIGGALTGGGGSGVAGNAAGGTSVGLAGSCPVPTGGGSAEEPPLGNASGGPAGHAGSAPVGEAGGGGEATGEAGVTEVGGSHGGAGAGRAGSAGRSGVAGSTTSDGGGGSKNHGCSIRIGSRWSRVDLAALTGLLSTLSWLRLRRRRNCGFART